MTAELSIIVCCYNSEPRLAAMLVGLREMFARSPDISFDLIIVDNNSADRTGAIAAAFDFGQAHVAKTVVAEAKVGLMNARITGINLAKHACLCFLDDDNLPLDGYFSEVLRVFDEHPEVGVAGCATRLPEGWPVPEAIEPFLGAYAVGRPHPRDGLTPLGSFVWGAGLAARTSILRSLFRGDFRPLLIGRTGTVQLAGDDGELCLAVQICGWRVWYIDEELISHAIDPDRFTVERLGRMYEGFGASSAVMRRYYYWCNGSRWLVGPIYPFLYVARCLPRLARYVMARLQFWRSPTLKVALELAMIRGNLRYIVHGMFDRAGVGAADEQYPPLRGPPGDEPKGPLTIRFGSSA